MSLIGSIYVVPVTRGRAAELLDEHERAVMRDRAETRARADRARRSQALPERPVHWTWLHGPAGQPDPGLYSTESMERRARSGS